MKLSLTPSDIKTLSQDKRGLWSYKIKTSFGDVKGSEIKTKEDAVKHAEHHLLRIIRTQLSK